GFLHGHCRLQSLPGVARSVGPRSVLPHPALGLARVLLGQGEERRPDPLEPSVEVAGDLVATGHPEHRLPRTGNQPSDARAPRHSVVPGCSPSFGCSPSGCPPGSVSPPPPSQTVSLRPGTKPPSSAGPGP